MLEISRPICERMKKYHFLFLVSMMGFFFVRDLMKAIFFCLICLTCEFELFFISTDNKPLSFSIKLLLFSQLLLKILQLKSHTKMFLNIFIASFLIIFVYALYSIRDYLNHDPRKNFSKSSIPLMKNSFNIVKLDAGKRQKKID